MGLRRKLRKQLAIEFNKIRPDIIDVVVWFISGGMENETIEQVIERILGEDNDIIRDLEDREEIVYRVLLESGREVCRDREHISYFREKISESIEEVKTKRLVNKSTHPDSLSMPDKSRPDAASFFSTKSRDKEQRVNQKTLKKRPLAEEAVMRTKKPAK